MNHLFCHGHGSLEDDDSYSLVNIPEGKLLILYAPPGAAIADNAAEEIMKSYVEKHPVEDVQYHIENHLPSLTLKGRESKGYAGEKPPHGFYEFPLVGVGGSSIVYPNLTLTGGKDLSHSGLYRGDGFAELKLEDGDKIKLRDIFDKYQYFDVIHWLACMSDHTKEKGNSAFYGFKVSM
ncbi:putative adhesin [Kluyvera sp. NPDC087067]|uniref:putative adhesin n=1 Tax=Kluyvera sp. NPDC087067 TaxID=3364105 RepID=UPI0037FF01F8